MCRSLSLSKLLAVASVAALAVACNGEHADHARDGALSNGGAAGGANAGATGQGGTGGSVSSTGGTGGTAIGTGGQSSGTGGQAGETGGQSGAPGGRSGATGGAGGGGRGGMGGAPGKPDGATCMIHAECMHGHCFDGVCCNADCSGKCRTCNGTTPGTCTLFPSGMDPKNDCPPAAPETCGSMGTCNGTGDCKVYPANTVCGAVAKCDSTSSAVISGQVCNGAGKCVDAQPQSCKGFLCSNATCAKTCSDDSACISGGFCSAAACVGTPNLAGNGDLETGTTTGWSPANGGGKVDISPAGTSGLFAHTGQYALVEMSRPVFYQGPSYNLPTGVGKYVISFWAMQNDDDGFVGVPQVRVQCLNSTSYMNVLAGFSAPMPKGTWVNFTGTVDFATDPMTVGFGDCFPGGATPGLVRSAFVYLNQPDPSQGAAPSPVVTPAFYVDDLVVQVTDGHNLIGNPNFEAGAIDGWSIVGGGTLGTSTNFAKTGARSLRQNARSNPSAGIKYTLPTGAARYQVTFNVFQAGTVQHKLLLQPSYTCVGSTAVVPPPLPSVGVDPNVWVTMSGTIVMPPVDAPAGCVLSQASVILQQDPTESGEFPDLYLDDASITLK